MEVCGSPFRFLATPQRVRRAAPALGEHNREILAELGYSEREVSELEAGGTVRRRSPGPRRASAAADPPTA
jgi:crotonobetainyl-CoA:carnitine CoA-transferase CaiB-like acyl-CoA transferase